MVDLNSSFVWSELGEEERYAVWSAHINAGGQDLSYPEFCNAMDYLATQHG
jgi:hypothetical protein